MMKDIQERALLSSHFSHCCFCLTKCMRAGLFISFNEILGTWMCNKICALLANQHWAHKVYNKYGQAYNLLLPIPHNCASGLLTFPSTAPCSLFGFALGS